MAKWIILALAASTLMVLTGCVSENETGLALADSLFQNGDINETQHGLLKDAFDGGGFDLKTLIGHAVTALLAFVSTQAYRGGINNRRGAPPEA